MSSCVRHASHRLCLFGCLLVGMLVCHLHASPSLSSSPIPSHKPTDTLPRFLVSFPFPPTQPHTAPDTLPDVVLIGFPFSEGTVRNGGRDGGFDGPRFVRQLYPGMGSLQNAEFGVDLSQSLRVADWGDIPAFGGLGIPFAFFLNLRLIFFAATMSGAS